MRKLIAQEFVSLDGVMEAPDKWQLTNDLLGEDAAAVCLAYEKASALSDRPFDVPGRLQHWAKCGC